MWWPSALLVQRRAAGQGSATSAAGGASAKGVAVGAASSAAVSVYGTSGTTSGGANTAGSLPPGHAVGLAGETPGTEDPARRGNAANGTADPSGPPDRRLVPGYEASAGARARDPGRPRRDDVYTAGGPLPPGYLYPVSYYQGVTTPSAPLVPAYPMAGLPGYSGQGPGDPAAADTPRRPTVLSRLMHLFHGTCDRPDCPCHRHGAPAAAAAPAVAAPAPPAAVIPLSPR
jgi:hypothetical protein